MRCALAAPLLVCAVATTHVARAQTPTPATSGGTAPAPTTTGTTTAADPAVSSGSPAGTPPAATPTAAPTAAPDTPALPGPDASDPTATNDADTPAPAPSAPATEDGEDTTDDSPRPCGLGGPCPIEDLKTPASPAFSLIGVAPETVVKPSTPRGFATAIYNSFGGANIPTGFALEAAPFWLLDHDDLTYEAYRDAGIASQLLHNLSLSVASAGAPTTTTDGTDSLEVSAGVRTNFMIYSFHPGAELPGNIRATESKLLSIQEARTWRRFLQDNNCEPGASNPLCEMARNKVATHESSMAAMASAAAALQKSLAARDGFVAEVASAFAFRMPTDKVSFKHLSRAAVWLTTGYTSEHWNLLALGRYLAADDPAAQFADLGGRLGANIGRFGVHVEALHRIVVDASEASMIEASQRLVGTAEVKVAGDFYVSASFGKDADSEAGKGGVVALAGISFQVGSKPSVASN